MSNAANAATALTNLQSLITSVEAGNLMTGDAYIDAQTRALLTTRLDGIMQAIFDYGSRAAQNAAPAHAQDGSYKQLDDFMRAIAAHISALNNPTALARRSQSSLH